MTFYERIQNSIDYIENHLDDDLDLVTVADKAFLSIAHFYRLFGALTGHTVKEYVTRRRLARALVQLRFSRTTILAIALRAGFSCHESFTRAFRREFSINPSSYRKQPINMTGLEPLRLVGEIIMKNVVIKELPEMTVAACQVTGKNPEAAAWKNLSAWARKHRLLDKPHRIFGFDNPEPKRALRTDASGNQYPVAAESEYGYEFWITTDSAVPLANGIVRKQVAAGTYAVTGATAAEGKDWIGKGWARLHRMMKAENYQVRHRNGKVRWFEEHLDYRPEDTMPGQLNLYLEIEPKT